MKIQFLLSLAVVGILCLPDPTHEALIELNEPSGVIKSPNYPNQYPNNTVNEWKIRLPNPHHLVFLRILYFFTEDYHDFLEIYSGSDGSPNGDYHYQRLSGLINHGDGRLDVVSQGPEMYIQFISDSSYARNGFIAEYYSLTKDVELTDRSGTFTSPNHPHHYNANDFIRWVIKPDSSLGEGSLTHLTFGNFHTEEYCDKVQIRTEREIIGTFSGNNQPPPLSFDSNDTITVYFSTDSYGPHGGFWASYYREAPPAAEPLPNHTRVLSNTFGELKSKNFPDFYPIQFVEEWLIEVANPTKDKVFLIFKILDIGFDDKLEIFDGRNDQAPLLAQLSGLYMDIQTKYLSSGPFMFLRLSTGIDMPHKGFAARYEAVENEFILSPLHAPILEDA